MKLFVYGSLKRGGVNHPLLSGLPYIGIAVSCDRYAMPDWCSGFPRLAPAEDGHRVRGELYEIDAATLARADRLEGHPDFFRRELRQFLAAGEQHEAWVYLTLGYDPYDPKHGSRQQPGDDGVLEWELPDLQPDSELPDLGTENTKVWVVMTRADEQTSVYAVCANEQLADELADEAAQDCVTSAWVDKFYLEGEIE